MHGAAPPRSVLSFVTEAHAGLTPCGPLRESVALPGLYRVLDDGSLVQILSVREGCENAKPRDDSYRSQPRHRGLHPVQQDLVGASTTLRQKNAPKSPPQSQG